MTEQLSLSDHTALGPDTPGSPSHPQYYVFFSPLHHALFLVPCFFPVLHLVDSCLSFRTLGSLSPSGNPSPPDCRVTYSLSSPGQHTIVLSLIPYLHYPHHPGLRLEQWLKGKVVSSSVSLRPSPVCGTQ